MGDFLIGLLVLALGLAVCASGLRLWFVMLPIWGFVAGLFVGAGVVTAVFGDGFLSTVTGWVFGLVVGLVFAALSYFVWYVGAIIAAGSVGALAGSGLMAAFDVDTGWVVFIVAAIGAALAALAALALAIPLVVVVLSTATAGATAVVAGVALIFNRIDAEGLDRGAVWAMIDDSWFWLIAWALVAGFGIAAQFRSLAAVALPEERWTRAQYGPPAPAAV